MSRRKTEYVLQAAVDGIQEQLEQGKSVSVHVGQARMPIVNNFALLFFNAFAQTIDDYNLSRNDIRVLLKICNLMQFGNLVKLSWGAVGDELGIKKQNMGAHVKKLKNAHLMIEDKNGNIFLNPQIIAKGKFISGKDESSIELLDLGASALEGTNIKPSILTEKLRKKQLREQNSLLRFTEKIDNAPD